MAIKIMHKGFSIIGIIIAVCVVGGIVLTGWGVWQHSKQTKDPVSAKRHFMATLKTYTFPTEKLRVQYDEEWEASKAETGSNPCGLTEGMTLRRGDFSIGFNFGTICGKGSAPCFHEAKSGCIAESKQLAVIQLSNARQVYALVTRNTINNGKNWTYSIALSDSPTCRDEFCIITPQNMGASIGGSIIYGSYGNDTASSGGTKTLEEYANLPAVKNALAVLKTVHY